MIKGEPKLELYLQARQQVRLVVEDLEKASMSYPLTETTVCALQNLRGWVNYDFDSTDPRFRYLLMDAESSGNKVWASALTALLDAAEFLYFLRELQRKVSKRTLDALALRALERIDQAKIDTLILLVGS